jgi:serine/threonine-protein kinase
MKQQAEPLYASTLPARTLAERPRAPRRKLEAGPRDFGPYRIEGSLGRGGMGEVFKAWDERLKRHVALKLILDGHPCRVARFRREAQAQARVGHPYVCQVYEVGEHEGQHYIAMQYIAGETLAEALRKATLEQRLTVMRNVAEALHAAHRQGLVHRDVKPSNVMVERADGGGFKAYVLDFGLALEQTSEITTTFELMGTPQFMAPEQLNEEARLDRRTDIYALGATFYTVLAGRTPFKGSLAEVMRQVVEVDPAPLTTIDPTLPADVETILAKCLDKEPQHRYDSARALAEDLDRFLNGDPIAARPHSLPYRLANAARKHRRLLVVAAVLLTALLTSLAWGWHSRRAAAEQTLRALRFGQKVEKIEAFARTGEMLPLLDVSDDRDKVPRLMEVRRLMAEIEDEMRELGPAGEGPGHYALGRGYSLLRDEERARLHFQAAWDAGYQGAPEAKVGPLN